MTRKPPRIDLTTPIDDVDVDLSADSVSASNGRRITDNDVDDLVDTFAKRGRPSLSAGSGNSPVVTFRLPPDLRDRAERIATAEGKTLSALAREALEARLNS